MAASIKDKKSQIKGINGWLSETEAARMLGFKRPETIRKMKVPRYNFATPGRKTPLNKYRVVDLELFIEQQKHIPQ